MRLAIKISCIFSALLLVLANAARGEVIIVTTNGTTILARDARREQATVFYRIGTSDTELQMLATNVFALVPKVERGKSYEPEFIQNAITNAAKTIGKYPNLLRQVNEILNEWKAVQKPITDGDKQIEALLADFARSDRSVRAYRRISFDLGMLRYKDVAGRYTSQIDKACEDIKSQFISSNMTRLKAMAANKMTMDNFLALRTLAWELNTVAGKDDKAKVDALLKQCSELAFQEGCRQVCASFESQKTVDAYLRCAEALNRIKNDVAETAQRKAEVDKQLAALVAQAKNALSSFSFDFKGYPFSQDDLALLQTVGGFCSKVKIGGTEVDEQCFIMPTNAPGTIFLKEKMEVPVRLVFNRAQPQDRVFGLGVVILGQPAPFMRVENAADIQIRNGHASAVFRWRPRGVPHNFVPAQDDKGNSCMYVYAACLAKGPDGNFNKWLPISMACPLPARNEAPPPPPEPPPEPPPVPPPAP